MFKGYIFFILKFKKIFLKILILILKKSKDRDLWRYRFRKINLSKNVNGCNFAFKGKITVDGLNINSNIQGLQKIISYIPQKFFYSVIAKEQYKTFSR